MHKRAPAEFPVLDLIAERWSPRAFHPRPVEPEKVLRLFEAARWAASSSNEQPWSFLVAPAENAAEFERLASVLVSANAWARQAPLLALSVARLTLSGGSTPNRYAFHDTGLAMGNLLLQATAEGLMVHQMGGFEIEKARSVFQIPEHHDPVAMIAIGYPGDPDSLPASLRERELAPRTRKPQNQFVFTGKWGQR